MANFVAALDFQKASGIVHRMQECIKNIHKFTGTFVGAAETALEKSTKQKWMSDIVDIGNGIQRQCVDVSEACDGCVDGLRKFDEDMRNFVDDGIHADI